MPGRPAHRILRERRWARDGADAKTPTGSFTIAVSTRRAIVSLRLRHRPNGIRDPRPRRRRTADPLRRRSPLDRRSRDERAVRRADRKHARCRPLPRKTPPPRPPTPRRLRRRLDPNPPSPRAPLQRAFRSPTARPRRGSSREDVVARADASLLQRVCGRCGGGVELRPPVDAAWPPSRSRCPPAPRRRALGGGMVRNQSAAARLPGGVLLVTSDASPPLVRPPRTRPQINPVVRAERAAASARCASRAARRRASNAVPAAVKCRSSACSLTTCPPPGCRAEHHARADGASPGWRADADPRPKAARAADARVGVRGHHRGDARLHRDDRAPADGWKIVHHRDARVHRARAAGRASC